jgi:hypothetical protein
VSALLYRVRNSHPGSPDSIRGCREEAGQHEPGRTQVKNLKVFSFLNGDERGYAGAAFVGQRDWNLDFL